MERIVELMADDHRACDEEFGAIEQASKRGDWSAAAVALKTFHDAIERHLSAEETTLFPAFEVASGSNMGPTRVMRMEHAQIRSLLDDLRAAVESGDAASYRGQAETLLILMQQHNLKEENILYPMCDEHLTAQAAGLCGQLGAALVRRS
jgi:iron-sulfur cluster repair protein YtfE (RIC family)